MSLCLPDVTMRSTGDGENVHNVSQWVEHDKKNFL